MAVWRNCAAVLLALMLGGHADAQHFGANQGPENAIISDGHDANPISIEPASSLEPKPVTPVTVGGLPDIGPDALSEAYLDGLFASQIAAGKIVGASLVVLRDGKVAVKKGYGVSDLDSRVPVDPDKTLFRVASISKPFAAILAMQQVEAGKLDLNSDVNAYLQDFKLAPYGPQPLTLAHLLTHTGGFDDRYIGMNAPMDGPLESLGAHLARRMPTRIRPAGTVLDYSNYGFGLAGYITELAAGQEFRALAKAQLFDKWQMSNSSYGIPAGGEDRMATPYIRSPGGLKKIGQSRVVMAPVGDLVTTAGDMGRFLEALAANGAGVLKPDTLGQMFQPQFTPGKTGDAWGLGFAIGRTNGVTWVGHGGDLPGYGAEFRFDPVTKSGFFIVMNVSNTFDVMQPIIAAICNRIWLAPSGPKPVVDVQAASDAAKRLVGTYVSSRRARADFTLLGAGVGALTLTAGDGGALQLSSTALSAPVRFDPVESGLWEARGVQWRLSAHDASHGILLGPFLFERPNFALNFAAQMPLLMAATLSLVLILAFWSVTYLTRRFFGEPQSQIHLGARSTAVAAALVAIGFVTIVLQSLSNLDVKAILEGDIGALKYALVLPYIAAALTLPTAVFGVLGFGSGLRARLAQGVYALVVISLLWILWFAWVWNLHLLAR